MKAMNVKNRFKILVIVLFTLVCGCNQKEYKESVAAESVDISNDFEMVKEEKVVSKFTNNQNNVPLDLKIIKTASARYKVNNVANATRRIKVIAQQHGAYISDLRFDNNLYRKEQVYH